MDSKNEHDISLPNQKIASGSIIVSVILGQKSSVAERKAYLLTFRQNYTLSRFLAKTLRVN